MKSADATVVVRKFGQFLDMVEAGQSIRITKRGRPVARLVPDSEKVCAGRDLAEALAQTGGVLMSKSMRVEMGDKVILFMSVDHCRFRYPVRPGDVLKLHVEVVRARGDVVKFRGVAKVGEKIAAEVEFAAMLAELPA